MAKERFDIPAAVENVKYHSISILDAVDDDVTANREASQTGR